MAGVLGCVLIRKWAGVYSNLLSGAWVGSGIFTTAKEAIRSSGCLGLVLVLDMRRHGRDRTEDHAPVVRETRTEDGIGDEVQGEN